MKTMKTIRTERLNNLLELRLERLVYGMYAIMQQYIDGSINHKQAFASHSKHINNILWYNKTIESINEEHGLSNNSNMDAIRILIKFFEC